jgi:AcrR family transcriptional regulator
VVDNQRDRILDAITHEIAEPGYPETAVADLRKSAGVSSKTFYELAAIKSALE